MSTVIVLNKDQMGSGDEVLGRKILATYLKKLPSLPDLEAIIAFNGGVKLVTKDSPVAQELTLLQEQGVDILACGTCLTHFGLTDLIVDNPSNMDDILACMRLAEKLITL